MLTTFAGAAAVACLVSLTVLALAPVAAPFLDGSALDWHPSPTTVLSGASVGTWSHVVLDALLYADVQLFAPSSGNPFLGLVSPLIVYGLCLVALLFGVGILG